MLQKTRDGHTSLDADALDASSEPGPARSLESPWLFDDDQRAQLEAVIAAHLDGGTLTPRLGGRIQYGTIKNRPIGYVAVHTMSDFTVSGSPWEDERAFGEQFDAVLGEFAEHRALIIDLRLDDGGWDNVAMAIASRLTDQARPAYSKAARIGSYDQFADPTVISFRPAGTQFLGRPVIVLVSSNTLSASEVCLLALRQLPNVQIVGETSYGIFANVLPFRLPNGWEGGLSNEIYRAADGTLYEHVGIPPQVPVRQDRDALRAKRDNVLDHALTLLPAV